MHVITIACAGPYITGCRRPEPETVPREVEAACQPSDDLSLGQTETLTRARATCYRLARGARRVFTHWINCSARTRRTDALFGFTRCLFVGTCWLKAAAVDELFALFIDYL